MLNTPLRAIYMGVTRTNPIPDQYFGEVLYAEERVDRDTMIAAYTINGAKALGMDKEIGTVEVGKLADFVILEENPLQNLKVLYGTGAIRVNDKNEPVRVGGVKYTVKDGIVYDAKQLLQDVRNIVDQHKAREKARITQPGLDW